MEEDFTEPEDDGWISSGADYSPKAEYKQAILIMDAIRFCREARAKEMKQGFWNNKIDKNGNAVKVWNEDQRKVFINSVIALEDLLSSECIADSQYKEFKKKIDIKLKEIFDRYAYSIFIFDNKSGGWKKTNERIMPQIEEELLAPSPQNPRVLMNIQGVWDSKVNAYYDSLVEIYDEILKELRNVIYRLKDFKRKSVIG